MEPDHQDQNHSPAVQVGETVHPNFWDQVSLSMSPSSRAQMEGPLSFQNTTSIHQPMLLEIGQTSSRSVVHSGFAASRKKGASPGMTNTTAMSKPISKERSQKLTPLVQKGLEPTELSL